MLTIFSILLTAVLAVAAPSSDQLSRPTLQGDSPLTVHTFRTHVDHFRPQDGRVVDFTYTLNLEHYRENGPIFIYVNNGDGGNNRWIESGLMVDIARQVGAALATADHRYFGRNIPTPSASFDDLQFLTVEQALGDLTLLIAAVREEVWTNGRVILWGVGYGASLAVHARKKFPHLVDAAWASSAYFRTEAFDTEYYDNLSEIIREHGGTACADRVENAFTELERLIENAESEYLQERLRLCEPLNTESYEEVGLLVFRFIQLIEHHIQRNHLNGIHNFCRDMDAIPDDPLNSLIRWIEYAYGGSPDCVTVHYETVIARIRQTNWADFVGESGGYRAMEYFYCSQLGGLQTTSDNNVDIFPADVITADYHLQYCSDVYGEQYNGTLLREAVELLNLSQGGRDQLVSNVVFSTAGLDPNIHSCVDAYDMKKSAVVHMQYNSIGADLESLSTTDSLDLTNVKTTIRDLVTRWATTVRSV